MFQSHNIYTDDGRYCLSALITNKGYESPSFYELPNGDNDLTQDHVIIDRTEFLLEEFYPIIKKLSAEEDPDYTDFENWLNGVNNIAEYIDEKPICFDYSYFPEFVEMIETAYKIGFFVHDNPNIKIL